MIVLNIEINNQTLSWLFISIFFRKPIHPSQKIIQNGQALTIQIKVIPNYELQALLLSFGSKVKVIRPLSLLESLKDEILKMGMVYEE